MSSYLTARLDDADAEEIVALFDRVYRSSYANELYADAQALKAALASGYVASVGARAETGELVAHMAMTVHPGATHVELGNTVVDTTARGGGLAWQVGNELSRWARERGFLGYLHYPTTAHHIMQRQSVKEGFETGLMLSYIPAETDAAVTAERAADKRQAATVVFQPYVDSPAVDVFIPSTFASLLNSLIGATPLKRVTKTSSAAPSGSTHLRENTMQRRGLRRLSVDRVGENVEDVFGARLQPCEQADFLMNDPAITAGVEAALTQGFSFCAWMPGYASTDVLRMQRIDKSTADLQPQLVNETAQRLLPHCLPVTN